MSERVSEERLASPEIEAVTAKVGFAGRCLIRDVVADLRDARRERDEARAECERLRATAAREALCDLMRDISEDHYCAGWMDGLEVALWRMVEGGDRDYGMGKVSEEQVARLRALAEEAGGWWVWSESAREVFVPLEQWRASYEGRMGEP